MPKITIENKRHKFTVTVDTTKLSDATKERIFRFGLRTMLLNATAGTATADEALRAMLKKRDELR